MIKLLPKAKSIFSVPGIILVFLILMVSLINLIWILEDTRLQPFQDPYPEKIYRASHRLADRGLTDIRRLINELSLGPRPPLYQLMALPCVYLFGRTEDSILVVNIFWGAVLILAVYGAGKLAEGPGAGLLAALLAATYPPLVNLSKIARPHSILPAFVALSLWLLLLLVKTRRPMVFLGLGFSLGIGFLVHPNFAYIMPLPVIIGVIYLLFFQLPPRYPPGLRHLPGWFLFKLRNPLIIKGLFPAVILAVVIPGLWYIPRMARVLDLINLSAMSWSGVRWGFREVPVSFWWYALTLPGVISTVFTFLLAVSMVVIIVRPRMYSTLVAVTFLLAYCGIGMRKGALVWMNGAAILPPAAVLTAVGLTRLCSFFCSSSPGFRRGKINPVSKVFLPAGRYFSRALIFIFIIITGFNFWVVTWGVPPYGMGIVRFLGGAEHYNCAWRMIIAFCPNPPRKEDWKMRDVLQAIVEDQEKPGDMNTFVVVVNNPEGFKYSALRALRARDFPELKLRIDPVQKRGKKPSVGWLAAKYLAYIPGSKPGKQKYVCSVETFLESPPDVFRDSHVELDSLPLPIGTTVHLLKRTRELSLVEVETSIAALPYLNKETKRQLLADARLLVSP